MIVSIIVAVSRNLVIGRKNDLPWHLPLDMAYFKRVTTGHHVILGRKNYESIPEKYRPLPNRNNIVVTRMDDYEAPGCVVVNSIEEALDLARKNNEKEAFIIGGGEIYEYALNHDLVDKMYVTWVETEITGDTYFPDVFDEWDEKVIHSFKKDDRNPFDITFSEYQKN